jgi:hypothetical protein
MSPPRLSFEYKITFGNLVQIGVVIGGLVTGYYALVGNVNAQSDALSALGKQVGLQSADIDALKQARNANDTRMAVNESRAEAQATNIVKLADTVDQINSVVQGLAISTATTKTDVGYIRDYIEEAKRQEKLGRQ